MEKLFESCTLCPRKCKVNRNNNELGYCRAGNKMKIGGYHLHMWEEPVLTGDKGSGTIFFSYCNLRCIYCQNYDISINNVGEEITVARLADICLELQNKEATNINLVTPTHYIPLIREALILAKEQGLSIPIVYNSSGYESVESLKLLDGLIDVYLPDFKYYSRQLERYSNAIDYCNITKKAIKEMYRQVGEPIYKNDILVKGCIEAGICAFTGDGKDSSIMENATRIIKENNGYGIPTVKPWSLETYLEKLNLALNSNAFAVAMDVDAAGLPFLKGCQPPAGRMNTEQLKAIISNAPVPFIVKGVMSVKGALKAKKAGASAIVVSNHGGRVQDQTPATAEVLEEIVKAVDGSMKIFVDGGLRNGVDIFKALALGADAVIVARPFVNAIYGAKEEGIQVLVDKLGSELQDTMEMCGAKSLKDITRDMVR